MGRGPGSSLRVGGAQAGVVSEATTAIGQSGWVLEPSPTLNCLV